MTPEAAQEAGRATRERAVLALGLGALLLGLTGLGWIAAGPEAHTHLPDAPERRLGLRILSLTGLGLGSGLVLLRRPLAARLVPVLAGGITVGLVLCLLLVGDLVMSYRAFTTSRPGESLGSLHVNDARLGWLPQPDGVSQHRRAGNFDVEYRMDPEGFREVPHQGNPERRLWFFGDSFTFGLGVGGEDAYANRIARDYLDPRVRVVNAGVSGHGVVQMYGRLLGLRDRLQAGDVVVFAPIAEDLRRSLNDFVFFSQFVFDDPEGELRFPLYREGRLESVPIGGPVHHLLALLFHAPVTEHIHRFVYRAITGSTRRAMLEAHAVLDEARTLCAKRGVGFLLVFLPRSKELRRGRYEVDVSSFDYVDIRRFFPSDPAARSALRYPDDAHWTPRGHELAAGALVAVLVERGLLAPEDLRAGVVLPRPHVGHEQEPGG